ncbi:MAG: methyltetrahydrofolate cobalamin methyltransferase [Desulfatirhabdiaceae bacterium]
MIIVGELLNASRMAVRGAIDSRDADAVTRVAQDQANAGANYIDVNAGMFLGRERELLTWLVETVQAAVDCPCCIDSPDPKAIESALSVHKGQAMINSISLEKDRFDKLLPVVSGSGHKVVALCMSDEGMPKTTDERLNIADRLINALVGSHVPLQDIYVDPLVQPVATDASFGVAFLDAVIRIKEQFEGVHIMCGLSNISYGLPERTLLNRVFMAMAVAAGMDGAIINPLDNKIMAVISAAEALVGRDDYFGNYLMAFRAGRLSG